MSHTTKRIVSLLCVFVLAFSTCFSAIAMENSQDTSEELIQYEDFVIDHFETEEASVEGVQNGEFDAEILDDDTDEIPDANVDAEDANISLQNEISASSEALQVTRADVIISDGWDFTHGADSSQDGVVDLPHTWNAVDTDKGFGIYDGTYFRGLGIYEKTLDVSGYQLGRVFIYFEAANKLADVYIDGEHVGRHIGGYTAFAFDITEYVQGKNSVDIKVEVNNSIDYLLEDGTNLNTYAPASTSTSAPDYNIYGGIYRDVHIINTSETHFALETEQVYASNGIYLDQSVSNIRNSVITGKIGDATLDITANVMFAEPGDVILSARVYDRDGEQVASASQVVSGEGGLNEYTLDSIEIDGAHLWNGRANGQSRAYLYRVVMSITDTAGNVVDQVIDRVGFRSFEYRNIGEALEAQEDGDIGTTFLLNGEEYPLYGAAMHADFKDIGNALTQEHWDINFALMNEIGLNTIRAAHYPYPQYFYSQADEWGYVVWAENAATNSMSKFETFVDEDNWAHSKGQLNTFDQLRELIYQNYNHPSIYTWCLMNEVSSNGDTTGGFFGGWGSADRSNITSEMVFMRQQDELVREIDHRSDRIVSLTANFSFAGLDDKLFYNADGTDTGIVDLIGAHYYFGTYTAGVDGMGSDLFSAFGGPQVPTGLSAIKRLYPDSMVSISEYGVGGDPNVFMKDATGEELLEDKMATSYAQLSSFYSTPLYNPNGTPYIDENGTQIRGTNHPIEYMSRWHETTYNLLDEFPWVMGTYIWNMFDFGINHRTEGGTTEMAGRNDKGLVSFDRETKKDPYFYYKAQWNTVEDFVHINTGNRWKTLDTRDHTWVEPVRGEDGRTIIADGYWILSNGPYVEQTYDIRVYSTVDYQQIGDQRPLDLGAIRLFVNGEQKGGAGSSGYIVPERIQKGVYVFKDVPITSREIGGEIDNEIRVEIYDYTPITNAVGSLMLSTTAGEEDYSLATTMRKYGDSGYNEEPLAQTAAGDKTALTQLIREAEALEEGNYTADSWAEFHYALGIAKMIVADLDATQEVIDAVITYLQNAILSLIRSDAGDAPWVSADLIRVANNGGQSQFVVYLGMSEGAAQSASITSSDSSIATVDPSFIDVSGDRVTVTGHTKGHTTIQVSWTGGPANGTATQIPVYVTDSSQTITYPVIFMSDSRVYAIAFAEEYQTVDQWPANPAKSGYRFDGWLDENGVEYNAGSIITGTTTLYAQWTRTGSSSSGGSRRGGSSSGGGSDRADSVTVVNAISSNISAAITDILQSSALDAVTKALESDASPAVVRFQNPGTITLDIMNAMVQKAGNVPLIIHADSISGSAVDVRLYFDPALATGNINLTASTGNTSANSAKSLFEAWFSNKIMVVSLEQEGTFGQTVPVAAKLDAGLSADEELAIYAYNSATNSYTKTADQSYRIDNNNYIHFSITAGGQYIISQGALTK